MMMSVPCSNNSFLMLLYMTATEISQIISIGLMIYACSKVANMHKNEIMSTSSNRFIHIIMNLLHVIISQIACNWRNSGLPSMITTNPLGQNMTPFNGHYSTLKNSNS